MECQQAVCKVYDAHLTHIVYWIQTRIAIRRSRLDYVRFVKGKTFTSKGDQPFVLMVHKQLKYQESQLESKNRIWKIAPWVWISSFVTPG